MNVPSYPTHGLKLSRVELAELDLSKQIAGIYDKAYLYNFFLGLFLSFLARFIFLSLRRHGDDSRNKLLKVMPCTTEPPLRPEVF